MQDEKNRKKASEVGHVETARRTPTPKSILLPGDPNRISLIAGLLDEGAEQYEMNRAQQAVHGFFRGAPLGAYSTGIGGPSAEIILTNLLNEGADTFIRVGTTGAIQEDIAMGDIIINDASIRLDGTSNFYMMPEFPAAASYEVVAALVQACENLGFPYHVGTGCTCGSFFTGQCRTTYAGYRPSSLDGMFADLRAAGVLNFEMEAAAIFTMARIFRKRAGMCAVVVAQRITGEWDENPEAESRACLVGAEAARILYSWDREKEKTGKRYFYPGIMK